MLNAAVFDGTVIKPVKTRIFDHATEYAWARATNENKVILTFHLEMSSIYLFMTVLVHEMVHMWEVQKYGRMGHGKRFRSWAPTIKETVGLELEEIVHEYYFA